MDQPEGDDEEAQEQEPNPEAFDEEQHNSDGEPGEGDEEKDQGHSGTVLMVTRTMRLVDRRKRTRTWTRMTAVTINMSQRADDGNNERTADMGRRDCQ